MPTFELLPQPWQGNVRRSPAGTLFSRFPEEKIGRPKAERPMQPAPGILFDTTQPGLKLHELWTVWGPSSPMLTVGRVAHNEFRALVRLQSVCKGLSCVSMCGSCAYSCIVVCQAGGLQQCWRHGEHGLGHLPFARVS